MSNFWMIPSKKKEFPLLEKGGYCDQMRKKSFYMETSRNKDRVRYAEDYLSHSFQL